MIDHVQSDLLKELVQVQQRNLVGPGKRYMYTIMSRGVISISVRTLDYRVQGFRPKSENLDFGKKRDTIRKRIS